MATKVKQESMTTKDIKTMIDDAVAVASVADLATARGLLVAAAYYARRRGAANLLTEAAALYRAYGGHNLIASSWEADCVRANGNGKKKAQ